MNLSALLLTFCDAVERREGARFAALFTEDATYHDVFYGPFTGRAAIASMIDDRFHRDANGFRWDTHEPVQAGDVAYVRYLFSFASRLPEADGRRVMFEGVAILRLRDGLIAEYREVADTGPCFAQIGFAPERIAKILRRQADALVARPEAARHVS